MKSPWIYSLLSALTLVAASPAAATEVRLAPVDEQEDDTDSNADDDGDADEPSEIRDQIAVGSEFRFGSYGRVRAATDLRGHSARPVNVVSFGSRIDERSYAELEFQQRFFRPEDDPTFSTDIVATLAFLDDFFHYTGDFDQTMALRNLYATGVWHNEAMDVDIWAGSRMLRGDDIYLLDFWPLDNLNTLGGGAGLSLDAPLGPTHLRAHGGINRLDHDFQRQVVEVPGLQFGTEDVVFLDRQRMLFSGRAEQQWWFDDEGERGLKAVLYGESHHLPQGQRRLDDGATVEALPADSGWLVGGQLGIWEASGGFFDGSFANLFLRYAADLAAYGELGIPFGVNIDETAQGASDWLGGLAGTAETPYGNATVGSYLRSFDTAHPVDDYRDYREAIVATRIHGYLTDHIHPGLEVSHQVRSPRGPYPAFEEYERPQQQAPTITKLSLLSAFGLEPRTYSRPQFRLIYSAAFLNESAQLLYRPEDRRRDLDVQHYLGVMVEWWFNSASY